MTERVFSFMEEKRMIEPKDRVVAGVSGGADSLCLLLLLAHYRERVPFSLLAACVDHGLRQEASGEAAYVESLCRKLKIPFRLTRLDVAALAKEEKLSIEEAGRKARYEAFEKALRTWDGEGAVPGSADGERGGSRQMQSGFAGEKIALAHHRGDNAETLLLHLFRGTGIRGLAGMRPVRGKVIRPMLTVNREEIEVFLRGQGISWCIDSTNREDTYTRNRLRLHVLPYVESRLAQGAGRHLSDTALDMAELMEHLEGELAEAAKLCCPAEDGRTGERAGEASLFLPEWRKQTPFFQKQLLLLALERAGGRKDIGRAHLESLMGLAQKEGYRRLDLPGGLGAAKMYDRLVIFQKKEGNRQDGLFAKLKIPGEYSLGEGRILTLELAEGEEIYRNVHLWEENHCTKYLDYDKINHCLTLRHRRQGDYLVINRAGQKKPLARYMIEEKIPAPFRDGVALLTEGSHVLWVVGHRISAHYQITEQTKRCLRVTVRPGRERAGEAKPRSGPG